MLSEASAWGGKVLLHREVAAAPRGAPTPRQAASGAAAASAAAAAAGGGGGGGEEEGGEDITRTTQYQPISTQVQAFWETTGDVGDIDQVGGQGARR